MSDETKTVDTKSEQENKVMPMERASQEIVDEAKRRTLEIINIPQWQALMSVAKVFWQSAALPASFKNEYQVVMALQAGAELDIQPITAMNSFYFVNGKLALYGDTAIALVERAGYEVEWGKCDAEEATVTLKKGGRSHTTTVKMADMRARGLTGKDVWVKYPENLLRFKAFHLNARFFASGALHNFNIGEILEADDVRVIPPPIYHSVKKENKQEVIEEGQVIDPRNRLAAALEEKEIEEEVKIDVAMSKAALEPEKKEKPKKEDSANMKRMKEAAEKAKEEVDVN